MTECVFVNERMRLRSIKRSDAEKKGESEWGREPPMRVVKKGRKGGGSTRARNEQERKQEHERMRRMWR